MKHQNGFRDRRSTVRTIPDTGTPQECLSVLIGRWRGEVGMGESKRDITRLVWHLNHDRSLGTWRVYARRAGYVIDTTERDRYDEHRVSRDGDTVALIHHFRRGPGDNEAFAFLFVPEAVASRRSRLWWRLTHPLTSRPALPWPRRESRV